MPGIPEHILLSRTDSIGDVMLTLPMAGLIKERSPKTRITFLGRTYTRPILRQCAHVDQVLTTDDLMAGDASVALRDLDLDACIHVFPQRQVAGWCKEARIPMRIGTSNRWWHWLTCNERVRFSRRNSPLHEAQLNLKLLAPFGIDELPKLNELADLSGFTPPPPPPRIAAWLRPGIRTVLLHPGSRGSAVEWGLDNFAAMIRLLNTGPDTVIVTGTSSEAALYRTTLPLDHPNTIDAGGLLSLEELMGLIGASDALVAASTGPLHIAAASGVRAVGLYSPRRPIHPGRWAPIGRDALALVFDPACSQCAAGRRCDCITRITPERVLRALG